MTAATTSVKRDFLLSPRFVTPVLQFIGALAIIFTSTLQDTVFSHYLLAVVLLVIGIGSLVSCFGPAAVADSVAAADRKFYLGQAIVTAVAGLLALVLPATALSMAIVVGVWALALAVLQLTTEKFQNGAASTRLFAVLLPLGLSTAVALSATNQVWVLGFLGAYLTTAGVFGAISALDGTVVTRHTETSVEG